MMNSTSTNSVVSAMIVIFILFLGAGLYFANWFIFDQVFQYGEQKEKTSIPINSKENRLQFIVPTILMGGQIVYQNMHSLRVAKTQKKYVSEHTSVFSYFLRLCARITSGG